MIKEILPVADTIIATEFSIGTDTMISNASYDASNLKSQITNLKYKGEIYVEKDSVKAVEKAGEIAHDESIIAITGSLYLIGELKQRFTF